MEVGLREDQAGETEAAMVALEAAWRYAAEIGEPEVESVALRRLAVIYHHRNRHDEAATAVRRSHAAAVTARSPVLEAEALNVQGGIYIDQGELAEARVALADAWLKGASSPEVAGKVAQNLGIIASVQGDHDGALDHFGRALAAFATAGDDRGRAVVYTNLGLLCVERGRWAEAESYFSRALGLARAIKDLRIQGLCYLNRADALFGQRRHESAREAVDLARSCFHRIGSQAEEADAYRLAGRIYRAIGRPELAETLLETAVELARRSSAALCEAEVWVDLADLSGEANRFEERRGYLLQAKAIYARLAAPVRLAQVDASLAELVAA